LTLSSVAKAKSTSSTKPPSPNSTSILLDYGFYRRTILIFLAVALGLNYIDSTTLAIFGVNGDSMYPLLRPSSDTLLTSPKLPPHSPSAAALLARPHVKDTVLVIPTSGTYTHITTLLKFLSWVRLLPPSPLTNDPTNYNILLGDNPVSEGGTGTRSSLERGMMVVFRAPYKPGHGYDPDRVAIKRIVGLEGDVVVPLAAIDKNEPSNTDRARLLQLWKDGGEFDDICSGRWIETEVEDKHGDVQVLGGVRVPYGHVWVEGVNQWNTVDSNDYGVISKSMITGVAMGVFTPWKRECDWRKSWRRDCGRRVFRTREGRGVLVGREERVGDGEVDPEWEI